MTSAPLKRLLAETTAAQSRAADPSASVWVSANAGTGKTHVLTSRVLRLLLAGTRPEHILCLTFTKAAATEMSTRLFRRLAEWASAPDDKLHKALEDLLGGAPRADEIARARQLFALAIETPGGLKVQTIHAFCERLLQRFPLEADVPPGFAVLDDAHAQALMREAIDATLGKAADERETPLKAALQTVVTYAADEHFDQLLGAMIAKRDWLDAVRPDMLSGVPSFEAAEARYRTALGIRDGVSHAKVLAEIGRLLPAHVRDRAITALGGGSTNDVQAAERLKLAADATDGAAAAAALANFFLTDKGEKRKSLVTNPTAAANPGLREMLEAAQDRFIALDEERRALEMLDATLALLRLAHDVRDGYAALKARRAALDYDDLIAKAAVLLAGDLGVPHWVHYKLDGGLSHILVDEAQDTSPMQWRVVAGLAEEFFSDAADDSGGVRTLFAVGDEKQSIYGFQGAAPHMLAEVGKHFSERARAIQHPWHAVPLTLSFRSAPPVIAAVDAVFADHGRTPGLTWTGDAIRHQPLRQGHAGLVEIWEPEAPASAEDADAFMPLDERPAPSPAARLAARIAQQIRHWLDTRERLESEDRPIEPGDILILVRRRGHLAPALIAALKQRDIPVSGADRMTLEQQIAIQDLMAVGEVVLLPEDDLALASVLKSPLIGLDDDDLLRFAPRRKGPLWSALLAAADAGDDRLAAAAGIIKQWRRSADFRPPFEFYAELLDGHGGRAKLMTRLGPEAADAIDEFMNLALRYDEAEPPSLQSFLDLLRQSRREIKRDLEHGGNQVRVMTVHGAKGLEAPIVFLPDTCSTRSAAARGGLVELADRISDAGGAKPVVWPAGKDASRVAVIASARNYAAAQEAEERNRLLYVALTRARDRLYVCGYDGKSRRPADCWYELIRAGLAGRLVEARDAEGRPLLRFAEPQTAPPAERRSDHGLDTAPQAPPEWAERPAPREPALAIPIAPSRLAPLDIDAEGEPIEPRAASADRPTRIVTNGTAADGDNRFLRGTLTHALLQYLPTCPQVGWKRAAAAFLEVRGHALPARVRASIAQETLAVLSDPTFAPVFGPRSRAEVAIVAEIAPPNGTSAPLRIAGQIDRLVDMGDEVLIVDYKTNRPPPRDLGEVPRAYVQQLAAYRLAVQRVFGISKVRAALLWTEGPRLMELPVDALEQVHDELFTPN
ncbi:MAG: double-strand break repair helicase AddA [Hyphomicrobiaceae bacterium]